MSGELDRASVTAWLKDIATTNPGTAFAAGDPSDCPLGAYLSTLSAPEPFVDTHRYYLDHGEPSDGYPLPAWAEAFVAAVDALPIKHSGECDGFHCVPATRALEILEALP